MIEMPDIPDFLRATAPCAADIRESKPAPRPRKKKRPANWYVLTKAEQDGTADATTIALRRQLERDKQEKQAARFAALRELRKR